MSRLLFFFFNDTATTEIYTLSLHDALPICEMMGVSAQHNRIHVAIAVWEWPSYFSPEARMAGIKLRTSRWRRPAPDTAPVDSKAAGLYMICTLSKHEAENNGFNDALDRKSVV